MTTWDASDLNIFYDCLSGPGKEPRSLRRPVNRRYPTANDRGLRRPRAAGLIPAHSSDRVVAAPLPRLNSATSKGPMTDNGPRTKDNGPRPLLTKSGYSVVRGFGKGRSGST